jgi:hypothetical protein
VAGLFVWRFWFLRDRHPNTDLLIQALESISGRENKPSGQQKKSR